MTWGKRKKSYGGHFLYTLSIHAHGPEEGFDIPLSVTLGAVVEKGGFAIFP